MAAKSFAFLLVPSSSFVDLTGWVSISTEQNLHKRNMEIW